jgi:cyanate permease
MSSHSKPLDMSFLQTPTTRATAAMPAAYRPAVPAKAAVGPSFFVLFAANFLGTLAALLVAGFLAFGAVCSFITNVQNKMKYEQQVQDQAKSEWREAAMKEIRAKK